MSDEGRRSSTCRPRSGRRTVVQGRRKDIGLGGTRLVPLAEAREKARQLRAVARCGGDPIAERDKDKRRSITFEQAARKVHADHIVPTGRNAKATAQWLSSLEQHVFPKMGRRPVFAVDQADLLRALGPIWLDKPETARRVKQRIKSVLDWARANGMGEGVHPVEGIEKALPRQPRRDRHFAALPWRQLPDLMERLAGMEGAGALALRFLVLTAARSGEVRGMTWGEIDIVAKVWTVPAGRMKGGREHRVPLSDAALAVLHEARTLVGDAPSAGSLVLPSPRARRPLSDMTLAAALKRAGGEPDVATVHGMRSTFRDWAEEATNYPHEVKEAALAHVVKNRVDRAYRRSDVFEKRREMMEAWASFAIQAGDNVVRLCG